MRALGERVCAVMCGWCRRTLSNSSWGDEGSLGNGASSDTSEWGALQSSAKLHEELYTKPTEALTAAENMMNVVVEYN